MLLKVLVEGEGVLDGLCFHQGETCAVCEAVLFVPVGLENLPASGFNVSIHPQYSDQGRGFEVVSEGDGHVGSAPLLQKGQGFVDDVVGRVEGSEGCQVLSDALSKV